MIEKWRELGHNKKPDEKPCWKLLLIAVAAPYGGRNPGFAQHLVKHHAGISGTTLSLQSNTFSRTQGLYS